MNERNPLAARLVDTAQRLGAEAADAMVIDGTSLNVSVRMGEQESLERSEGLGAGLRVLHEGRQATVATSETDDDGLSELVNRAFAMARVTPEDPHAGLPSLAQCPDTVPDLELADEASPSVDALQTLAQCAEDAARSVEGITNSEGGNASASRATLTYAASNGFEGTYSRTGYMLSASVVAGTGTGMVRDYDYVRAVCLADLGDAEAIGRRAGERTVARLHPRKAESGKVSVVFEPRVASGFLSLLARSASGEAVARGTTFLKDRMGEPLFPAGTTITEDPLRPAGHRSQPFDGEGSAGRRFDVIADGRLVSWFLDQRSARQLGLESTGSARRSPGGVPSPGASNLFLAPGKVDPDALMADIPEGLYVTEMLGMSFNAVTGDYSRGASGFWIENGERVYPVSEITVAGNLVDMFAHLRPANDLSFRSGVDSPTVRVDGMTVAGL